MRTITVLAVLFLLTGCSTPSRSDNNPKKISEQRQLVRDELSSEVSLKADRHQLDDLRQDIPKEKQAANDELAFSLDQTADVREEPGKIRQRFQNRVEKKRRRFNEKVEKLRKKYQREETARRDQFLREQNKKREAFRRQKKAGSETHDFYADLDRDRLDFFSKEREKRGDFDDEILQQTKDFNEYMKLKNDEFVEQMRIYRGRYDDAKKARASERAAIAPGGGGVSTVAPQQDENPKLPEPPYDHPDQGH